MKDSEVKFQTFILFKAYQKYSDGNPALEFDNKHF